MIASCANDRARPDTAVSALQAASPTAMIVRRERRSASRAIGMLATVKKSANVMPVRSPIAESETCSSSLIGWRRIARIWRSTKLKMYATKRSAST
jgi:hypothetical protein